MGSIANPQTSKQGGWLGKIDALLDTRLQSVKWGTYEIGELFEVLSYKKRFDANKVKLSSIEGFPYIVRQSQTNGQKGYINEDTLYLNEGNTISFGQDTATMFYQEHPYFTGDKIKILKPKYNRFGKQNAQFFLVCMRQAFRYFSWGTQSFSEFVIKKQCIHLPQTAQGEIDFDFMEDFVRELESERLRELEAYLKATGLKDYILTPEEELALKQLSSTKWKEYKITDIFNINNTHNILSSSIKDCPGKTPYLCASSENNGVSAYISYNELLKERGNCIFIGGKTFVVSYQQEDFFSNDSHNLALYLKAEKRTRLNQLYLATCIKKSLGHKYTWGDSISRTKIQKDTVNLPLSNDSKPDYALMETLIRAVQKLVIRNVVLYADRRIAATKEAINQHV